MACFARVSKKPLKGMVMLVQHQMKSNFWSQFPHGAHDRNGDPSDKLPSCFDLVFGLNLSSLSGKG